MSSTYTSDKTLAEAPSAVPAPDTVPILTLPSPGDGDTAASIAQAFKALGNEIAFLKFPSPKSGVWEEPVLVPFNARGFRRAYTDHLGYRQFRGVEVTQDWRDWLLATSGWPTSATYGQPWAAFVTTGTVIGRGPTNVTPATPLFPTLKLTPPTAAAERVTIVGPGLAVPSDNLGVALKASVALDTIGTNRTTITAGLGTGPSGSGGAQPAWGVWFEKADGDTNWQCKANGTGSGPLTADSGVAPSANTFQELLIYLVGSGVSDDAAGHAVFLIDGVPVATLNLTVSAMPSSTDPIVPFANATTTTTAGAAVSLYVGPVSYRHNTAVNEL